MLDGAALRAAVEKHRPDYIVPEIEAIDTAMLGELEKEGWHIVPSFADHFRDFDPRGLWGFVEHLVAQSMHVYTQVELIDLDTVRLLGLFKEDSASGSEALGGAIDLVDLFAALGSPEANDVANFSLDLLPSVLETRRVDRRADVRRRRLRVDRAQGQHRLARAVRARVRPRDLRAEGRRPRAALLRPREAARGRAPPAVPPGRLLGVDARPAPGVRARPRARADQEADARGRRDLGAVLRLAPARDDQDRPLGPGAGAVPAVVPHRARPQLRQGVPPAARRGHAAAPRAEAPRRALHRSRTASATSSPS